MSETLQPGGLRLHHIFGLKGDTKDNVQYVDESEVLYPAGHTIVSFNMEKKTQRFITGELDRSEISAMTVHTAKGRLLAVAERGERARIMIYDLATYRKKIRQPLVCPDVLSKEFVSMCFSPDGRFLLAQGGAPDWTLVNFQWEKGKAVQVAQVSNQSAAPIHQCSYCPTDPTCVCVSGNGILRFLRLEQSEFKSIQFSVGKREPQNYLCHTWVDDRVLVATDTGEILVFENAEFRGVLASSPANGKSIDSIAAFSKGFVCGCEEGVLYVFERDEKEIYKENKSFQIDGNYVRIKNLSISPSEDNVICTLENNQAFVLSLSNTDILKAEEMNFEPLVVPFHQARVTGLDACIRKPLVVTCSADKSVRVWNYVERTLEAIKFFNEEPLSVAFHPSGLHVLVGFPDCLRFINLLMDEMRTFREFTVKNCSEVRFSNGGHYFAAVNTNVVQVFSTYTLELVGNLRGHKGKVRSLMWSSDDSTIVSTGTDGQMFEWRLKEGTHSQNYQLATVVAASPTAGAAAAGVGSTGSISAGGASSPLAAAVAAASRVSLTTAVVAADSVVYLAATDRTVRQIEDSKERARVDVGDVVSQLAVTQRQGTRVLYCGLENGAIRVFPIPLATTGALAAAAAAAAAAASASSAPASVASFECHASAVSRLRVSFDGAYLFSVSEDGCLAVFEIEQGGEGPVVAGGRKAHEQALPWAEEILVTKSDLQEKLQAMTDLRNKVEELQYHNHMQLRLRKLNYKEKLREVTDKFNHELEADRERYLALEDAKSEMVKRYTRVLDETEQALKSKAEELEAAHARKMSTEKERIEALRKQIESNARQNAEQRQRRERVYKEELQAAEENLKKTLAAERAERQRLEAEKSGVQADFEQTKDLMEEDADEEVDELKATYDAKLTAERLNMLRLKDENAILKRKYGALRDEIKQHKDTIRKREDKQKMLYEQIRSLEKDLEGHLKEIQERDSTIQDKVKRIMQLRKKNQELEKFKFVLDYKIKELKRQIAPRQKEIKELGEQIAQMTNELNNYKSRNAHLQLEVHELGLKFGGAEKEADAVAAQHEGGAALLNRIKADLADLLTAEGDFKKLKLGVKRAYHTHVTREPSLVMSSAPADEHVVHQRQRYYLERSVDALSKKLRKDLAVHEAENRRIMSENIALVKEINELRREIQLLKQRAPDAATLGGGWGGGGTQNVWRNPNESKGDEAKAATAGDSDLKGIARAQAERIAELRQLIEAEGGDSAAAATSATETPTREAPRASAVPVQ